MRMRSRLHGKINGLSSNEKRRIISKSVSRLFYQNLTGARKERSRSERDAASIGHPNFGFRNYILLQSAFRNRQSAFRVPPPQPRRDMRLIPIYMNFSNYLLTTDDEIRGGSFQSSSEVGYVLLCKREEIRENILSGEKMLFSATS